MRLVARELGPALEGRVVELGCGTGQIAELLLDAHPAATYLGLDLSERMLAAACRRLERFAGRVELRRVSGPLPLDGVRCDGAFGVDVLHHVEEPVAALRELRAALAPGAPVVFLEGNPRFPLTALIGLLDREERGLFRMTFANLRRWLAAAGLERVDVRYAPLYTPPAPPAAARVLDAVDAALARVPVARSLALFYLAAARAPRDGV
jgi:SAM-dependent methyltransferase